MRPVISVICPALNEERYIEAILRHFQASAPSEKELFIIDGGSGDRTREIVSDWAGKHPEIRLLDNPEKYVPFALNKAIPLCRGRYIVRIDAHAEYSEDYYQSIIRAFENTGADIVGGPTRTKSTGPLQAAVAHAICTPFGIGNSKVHQEDFEGFTDSVTFGAWRREIFEKTGLFDDSLVRNQDDEFHYRAKSLGFSIYQDPKIVVYYYPRNNLSGLFSQYFQYGFFKPRVLKKVPTEWKWRHLIPSFFSLYLLFVPLISWLNIILVFPFLIYLLLDLYFAFNNDLSLTSKFYLLFIYPTIHLSYGLGFLFGLFSWKKS